MLLTLSLPIIALFTVNFILKKNKKNKKRCLKNSHNSLSWFSFYLVFLKFCINVVFKYFMEFFKKEINLSKWKQKWCYETHQHRLLQPVQMQLLHMCQQPGRLPALTYSCFQTCQSSQMSRPACTGKKNNNKQTTTLEFRCIFNTSQLVLSALISLKKNNRINAATLR